MSAQSFTDAAALSAALLTLRPRARMTPGMRCTTEVAGLGEVMWLCAEPSPGIAVRWEVVGLTLAEPLDPGWAFNRQAFVDLLPEELIPGKVTEAGRRIAFNFRVEPGHFRCRDCRWGDATDARGTHPGSCADCAAERTRGVRRAMPAGVP